MVGALGFLYGGLFGHSMQDYLPYLALGLIFWAFMASFMTEGCTVFTAAAPFIHQVNAPLSIYVFRLLWKNLIILAHNALVFVAVAAVFGVWPGAAGLLVLPALVLVCLAGLSISALLGVLTSRFRDIPPIVTSLVQILFFVSPILWKPEQVPARAVFVEANPFFHLLNIVRQPLLGRASRAELLDLFTRSDSSHDWCLRASSSCASVAHCLLGVRACDGVNGALQRVSLFSRFRRERALPEEKGHCLQHRRPHWARRNRPRCGAGIGWRRPVAQAWRSARAAGTEWCRQEHAASRHGGHLRANKRKHHGAGPRGGPAWRKSGDGSGQHGPREHHSSRSLFGIKQEQRSNGRPRPSSNSQSLARSSICRSAPIPLACARALPLASLLRLSPRSCCWMRASEPAMPPSSKRPIGASTNSSVVPEFWCLPRIRRRWFASFATNMCCSTAEKSPQWVRGSQVPRADALNATGEK